MKYLNPKRSIKPQKAIKILKEHGQEVTYEQAELILDFMYKFGQIAVDIYVTKDEKKVTRIEPPRTAINPPF